MTAPAHESDRRLTFDDVVFEHAACPVCGSDDPSGPILTGNDPVWRKAGTFTLVRCNACAMVYQKPRPTRDTMRYYYEDCYSGEGEEKMRSFMLESPLSRLLSAYRLGLIEDVRKLEPGEKVLDVGASYGAFIDYARTERGIEAYAIDLDPGSIETFVNTDDIDVRCGDITDRIYPADFFDVVTLLETLEHMYDPVDVLREVFRILKPGGYVLVEVPNWDSVTRMVFRSWWLPLLLPTHLNHFPRHALADCAERAGFVPVRQKALFYPAEIAMSVGVGFGRIFGNPPEDERGPVRRAVDKVFGLVVFLVFVFVDIPVVLFLRMFGRSGHQALLARKPDDSASATAAG